MKRIYIIVMILLATYLLINRMNTNINNNIDNNTIVIDKTVEMTLDEIEAYQEKNND